MRTPTYADPDLFWVEPRHTRLRFSVRACHSATVALASPGARPGGGVFSPRLEIVIGADGNQRSLIRDKTRGDAIVATTATPGVVSCETTRRFWVGWAGGNVRVGRGEGGDAEGVMLDWEWGDAADVVAVGVYSGGDTPAQWSISQSEGDP